MVTTHLPHPEGTADKPRHRSTCSSLTSARTAVPSRRINGESREVGMQRRRLWPLRVICSGCAAGALVCLSINAPAQAAGDATTRVSVATNGHQGNGNSGSPALTADGSAVVFASDATNLIGGDTNATWDVFVRNVKTGTT